MGDDWSGRTVLVTGAAGAVGSVVAQRLAAAGARVRALARHTPVAPTAGIGVVRGDLADEASLRSAADGCDLVVHCAAELSDDLAACTATNVDGTRNLMAALRASGGPRLVHLSTVSVYDARSRRDFDEECATWQEPLHAYGWSKAEGERIVQASELPWTIVRPVIVLSLHARSYWGPLALERARQSTAPVLGLAELPYVHVDNLVTAILLAAAAEKALGRTYDAIDGAADTRAYLDALYAALERPAPSLPEGAPRVTFAGRRLRDELGWAPPDRWPEFLRQLATLPA